MEVAEMKLLKVPKLRFREFEGEWILSTIENHYLSSAFGPRFSSDLYDENGNVLTLRTTDMDDDGKLNFDNAPIAQVDLEQLREHVLEVNDIVVSRSGTIGVTGLFKGCHMPVIPGAFLIRIRLRTDELHPEFTQYFLNGTVGRNEVMRVAAGGVQKNVTSGALLTIPLHIPAHREQQKIAGFLSAVDERLGHLARKKQLLEQYKKGVMQQLFSQQLRFKREDGSDYEDWEEKRLGELCFKKSTTLAANSITENSGQYKVFGASGVCALVDFFMEESPYVAVVKDGAGVGRTVLCEGYSSALGTLQVIQQNDKSNLLFLYYVIQNLDFTKYITGSTIPHVYFKDYTSELIATPSLKEQQKIADFLSSLDEKIDAVGAQIQLTQQFKKGLLQELFV